MEVVLLAASLNTLLPRLWDNREDKKKRRYAIDNNIEAIGRQINWLEVALEDPKFKGCFTGSALELKHEARKLSQETWDCIQRFSKDKKASRKEFASKTEAYSNSIQNLCDRVEQYSSREMASEKPPDPHVANPIGMAEPVEELLELVTEPWDGRRKVISILGFPGLGKTLLARLVYDRTDCTLRARVTAAAKDANQVLREILVGLGIEGEHDNRNLENLGQLLEQHLRGNRYLIVIDDIQSMGQWNDMKDAFPEDGDADGTIIVTTTIQSVASVCSSCNGHVYKLSPLDDEKSLDLFLRDRTSWDRCLIKENAADILEICEGLPLAIVSISQFLADRGVPTSRECNDAFKQVGNYLLGGGRDSERLRWVLMNKYTGLTGDSLRSCLLYFCMYRHKMDAVPRKNSLIRRWEAEGFLVTKCGSSRPMDVAAENIKTLVDHSIVQSMEVGTDGCTTQCRPPGMMVEYISQISKRENFAALVSDAVPSGIRRLSFHPGSARDDKNISRIKLQDVLTLAVSEIGCEAILHFKKYELVAVLDLKECTNLNDSHVKDICKLKCLKYLSLGETIGEIPRDMVNLIQLETLEMRRNTTVSVYPEVLELPSLRHLLGNFKLKHKPDERLKNFLSKNSCLETITGFLSDTAQGFPQLIRHLKWLRKVKIYCTANATEIDQRDLQIEIKAFTRESTNEGTGHRSLSIDFAEFTGITSPLEFLQEPGSLNSLKLRGNWIPFFLKHGNNNAAVIPDFAKISGIKKLCLSRTYLAGHYVLALLSKLKALECLKLDERELGPLDIRPGYFQNLVRFCLVAERSLHGITIQNEALPSLVSFHLICKAIHPGIESSIGGGRVRCLAEIALDSQVHKRHIQDAWKTAAKSHPNRPQVLLIKKGATIRQA